jgi:ATP-dependent helicase HepA
MRKNIEKGRDKLLEFNSRNPEKAKEITDEIRRFDEAPELESLIVDSLRDRGLYVEPSVIPNCSVVTMGPQVEAGTIPGMPSQGMIAVAESEEEQGSESISLTITFDRATAMIHDEIDFVSLEHPLAQGVIDFETGLSHGAVACNIWQNSGTRGLMMQYNFLVELPVLEEWGVADIAGPRYVSVIIDAKGEEHPDLLAQLQCGQFKDVGVPQGNSAVDMTLKFFAKEGFAAARRVAMASAKEYAEGASAAVEARCEQEYQRMNHLLTMRGKGGNSAQLQQLRKNVQEWKKVVSNPQIRLDAIRLLVCR